MIDLLVIMFVNLVKIVRVNLTILFCQSLSIKFDGKSKLEMPKLTEKYSSVPLMVPLSLRKLAANGEGLPKPG
jgi:hypothetical protein